METRSIFTVALIFASIVMGGCNFFGKKEPNSIAHAPGDLGNGISILGTFSFSTASTSSTRNPKMAETATYTFDPAGGAQIEVKDAHKNGETCTAYGQTRIVGDQEVLIYVQGVSSPQCTFPTIIHLNNIQKYAQRITYNIVPDTQTNTLFMDRGQNLAPVGIWDFQGQGGMDFLFLDPHGYFIVQTTDHNVPILLLGFYQMRSGSLTLTFFADLDPTHILGQPIQFSHVITDGQILQLVQTTSQGDVSIFGVRL